MPQALPARNAWHVVCCERDGAGRRVEDFAVPVQDGAPWREGAEQRVAGVEDVDRGPAELLDGRGAHLGAERPCDELGSEADAQDGHAGGDRLFDPGDLGGELRNAAGVVDAHGAAHDHGGADRVERRQRAAGFECVEDPDRAIFEGAQDAVRAFPGDVADDQDGQAFGVGHAGAPWGRSASGP
jgi:hypothetical protein